MDSATISTTVKDTWTMLQPYLPIIATHAAGQVGKELPGAVGKIWGALKSKLDTKQAAKGALSDLLKNPTDADLQGAFRVQIKKILEEDLSFASELQGFVNEAGTHIEVNVESGAVAIGDHAKAVGEKGILIEGSVGGNFLGSSKES